MTPPMRGQGRRPWGALLAAATAALLVAGCEIAALGEQPPTRFYVLGTLEDRPPAVAAPAAAVADRQVSIGVTTFAFPPYLQRKQIVTRSTTNQLVVEQFHKWGSAPDEEFNRALTANLRVLDPGAAFLQPPFRAGLTPDYEIRVAVQRFERLADASVVLDAHWVILRAGDTRPQASQAAQIRIPGVAADIPAVVTAMSAAVVTLSEQVAGDVSRLPPRRGGA